MPKLIDFSNGLFFHTNPGKSSFVRELKKILKHLNVKFHDPCCEESTCDDTVPFYPTGLPENLNEVENDLVSVESYQSYYDGTTDGNTFDLPEGTIYGQLKKITLTDLDEGGLSIYVPSKLSDDNDFITFNSAGAFVLLVWTCDNHWRILEQEHVSLTID